MSNQQTSWFDDEKEFEDLKAGYYTAKLTNATLDETKEVPRLSIEFTLENKRKVWLNLRFQDSQKKFANWQFRELGVYDKAKELATGGMVIQRAFLEALKEKIGTVWTIEVSYREYQGKQYQSTRVECEGGATAAAGGMSSGADLDKNGPQFDANEQIPF